MGISMTRKEMCYQKFIFTPALYPKGGFITVSLMYLPMPCGFPLKVLKLREKNKSRYFTQQHSQSGREDKSSLPD